jgi:hypothetical protein
MNLTYSYIYHWYVLTVLGHDSSHICPPAAPVGCQQGGEPVIAAESLASTY